MISYQNKDIKFNFTGKRICSKWIKNVVDSFSNSELIVGNLTIVFCDDNYILSVNNEFLKHNYYTDIITFDYTHDNILSGDLLISIDTVKDNSVHYDTLFREELNRVIIHGVLHLMGYNDHNSEEKKEMKKMENLALTILNTHIHD